MGKLKLKDPAIRQEPATGARIATRFAQPTRPSILSRLGAGLKRIATRVLALAILAAAFLALPFQKWDDYAKWQAVQTALIRYEAQQGSLPALQQLHAAASALKIPWSQPHGPRPEKWYQFSQRYTYDASYGMIQTLCLGLVRQGYTGKGLDELDRLAQRTGSSAVPNFPPPDLLTEQCSRCQNGKVETACSACDGQGSKTVNTASQSFPLKATLKNTFSRKKTLDTSGTKIRQNCPSCSATGKIRTTCPSCNGQGGKMRTAAVPGFLADRLMHTREAIDQGMLFRRVIHTLAETKAAVLGQKKTVPQTQEDTGGGEPTPDSLIPVEDEEVLWSNLPASPPPAPAPKPASRTSDLSRLQAACETLLEAPFNRPELLVLANAAKTATGTPEIQQLAMTAFSISLLLRGYTNEYQKVAEVQAAAFADNPPPVEIREDDYWRDCGDCGSSGKKNVPCPSCKGPNACQHCQGTGKVKAGETQVSCAICQNSPPCARCQDNGVVLATCPDCLGAKKVSKLSERIRTGYIDTLRKIVAQCKTAIASIPETAVPDDNSGPQPAAEQTENIELYGSTPPAPEAPQHERPTPAKSRGSAVKVVVGAGIVLGGIVLLLSLRRKKTATRFSSLPGMQAIDKDAFTDPLSLTAQDSRNRRHQDDSDDQA